MFVMFIPSTLTQRGEDKMECRTCGVTMDRSIYSFTDLHCNDCIKAQTHGGKERQKENEERLQKQPSPNGFLVDCVTCGHRVAQKGFGQCPKCGRLSGEVINLHKTVHLACWIFICWALCSFLCGCVWLVFISQQ